MAREGLAEVNRQSFNLETVVFSAQQEVTVPVSIKIPEDTQYLLQPVLVLPQEKVSIYHGPGKIRVQGQLEGFISCVSSDEVVHTIPVQPMEFMTAFSATVSGNVRFQTDTIIEGIEVDRGEGNVANLTVFIVANLWALKCEETEMVTAISDSSLVGESGTVKLQNIVKELETEHDITISIPGAQGVKPIGTELGIGNLSWQVDDGLLRASGTVMVKMFDMAQDSGELTVYQGSQDFEVSMDFGSPEVTDSFLQCRIVKATYVTGSADEGLDLQIELFLRASGYQEITTEYIIEVTGADSLAQKLILRNRAGETEYKLNLDGMCQFPTEPEYVNFILPRIRILEAVALDGRAQVRGMLSLNFFYTDANGQNRVLVQEEEFSQHLELEGCAQGFSVKAWAWPEEGTIEGGRYHVPALLRIEVIEDKELTAITDIHIVDPSQIFEGASVVLYLAKKEDSLFSVARKFNVSLNMLRSYNRIPETEKLYPGQKLMIPLYQRKYHKTANKV